MKIAAAIGFASVGLQLALAPLRHGTFAFTGTQWAGVALGVVLVAMGMLALRAQGRRS